MEITHKHLNIRTRLAVAHKHESGGGHRALFIHKHPDLNWGSWDDLRARNGRPRHYPEVNYAAGNTKA